MRSSYLLLFLAAIIDEEEEEEKEKKKRSFINKLNAEGRRRRQRKLPRAALQDPNHSAWTKLFMSQDDGALITVTGFDHQTFAEILSRFAKYYYDYTPWTRKNDGLFYKKRNLGKSKGRGRKRKVSATCCLGLVLAWYRFRGSEFILQGWFGLTGTQLSVWLRFGRRMLLKVLSAWEVCHVRYPTEEEMVELKRIVQARHFSLHDVYCTCDGLKLHFEACADLDEQNMYCNGWTHGHYVTNLFVFGADGRIIDCIVNVPGFVHDSTLAVWGKIYEHLKEVYDINGGICCVDSAFASANVPYLIRSGNDCTTGESALEVARLSEATSLRQAAEWGMRAIQSSMPRLKDHIKFEKNGERGIILKLVPLLYNLRLARVGLNQIANTYVASWNRDTAYFIKSNK